MSKIIKVTVKCYKCGSPSAVPIAEEDVGKKKQVVCYKCRSNFLVNIPQSYASKFVSEPTMGGVEEDIALLLEVIENPNTEYQSFELTSDYYTIGRKNNSGPASRPDVEVITTDMKMSRKHAAIRKKGKTGFTLKDLGSKNGVELNNNKLDKDEEVYLGDGDVFQLGDTKFRVTLSEKSE